MTTIAWNELHHAYGKARDIPALLDALRAFPDEGSWQDEPWHSLWSSLCHQGDVYSASFAAVVEIDRILAGGPARATTSFFALPASIEVARVMRGVVVPADMVIVYHDALKSLQRKASDYLLQPSDTATCAAGLALIAAASGQLSYANLLLTLTESEADEMVQKFLAD
jgi:hypothetical protein